MIILAVESSCDETSVAVVKNGKEVLSNIVLSQIDIHKVYGGVVPELASRNHVLYMIHVFDEAIKKAKIRKEDIDLVAVTKGPGLIGSLIVGINAAATFAYSIEKPIIGVNHLIGHLYSANIEKDILFPAIALLVSGGHTSLIYLKNHFDFLVLGETRDDAVGEAYDKVARTLNLSYPGGPIIDKLSIEGEDIYNLPRPMIDDGSFDFSFSGIKSAVINKVHNLKQKNEKVNVNDMAKSFQESVIDVLINKTKKAVLKYEPKSIIIAGGVAANKRLRERVKEEFSSLEINIPKLEYCTDNAAMIGAAAYYQYLNEGVSDNYIIEADSSLEF